MRSARSRIASAAAVLVALLPLALVSAAAAQDPTTQERSAPADDRAAIAEVARERARALRAGDRDAFVATLDDPSSGFGRRQLRLFENFDSAPLAAYRLEVDWEAYGDMARRRDRRRYPDADAVAIPFTRERYRVRGVDAKDVFQNLYLTYVKRDGEWRIGADDDLAEVGFQTAKNLWDFGPVGVLRSDRFVALAPSCASATVCTGSIRNVLPEAERALDLVDRYWTRPWPRKVSIVVPGTSADLVDLIQATYPVDAFVAFAYWTGGEGRNPGVRIIANPGRFIGQASERTSLILSHELVHVATLRSSGNYTPHFIDEGLAQYVSEAGDPATVAAFDAAARALGARIPEDYEFFVGGAGPIYAQYQRSMSVVAYFIERWGFQRFQRFYVRLGKASAPGTTRYHVDAALEETIGMDLRALERAWASSIDRP